MDRGKGSIKNVKFFKFSLTNIIFYDKLFNIILNKNFYTEIKMMMKRKISRT